MNITARHLFRFVVAASVMMIASDVRSQDKPSDLPKSVETKIDDAVKQGLDEGQMAGAVVCVGRLQGISLLKAYGHRQIEPAKVAMTTDTVFDMASITKPVATATSVMLLIERGDISLHDRVAKHLPDFAQNGKGEVTIKDLLIHQSGLTPDNALSDYDDGPEQAIRNIHRLSLRAEPKSKFMYSDVGFIVLAEIVRAKTGQDIHEFSQTNLFVPLGMKETGYLPRQELRERSAATEQRDDRWMIGEVHDPRAYKMGGVAGHAGLFSAANDLAIFARMLLNGGSYQSTTILKPETLKMMSASYKVSSGIRGLGWDKQTGYSSNKGDGFSDQAFGHGGFTGTTFWVDPELDLFVIFLSNRLHPDGKGSVNRLAGKIGTIVAESFD